ncbi:MAG: hypothetical protein J3R72DRAFT_438851 [Linnemannia gamsii]|nr:MAG: hypothetical protein J3R72DRAFT_438851 [Linnemannia gamsii]
MFIPRDCSPSSLRDTVVLGTIKELNDGRYFNVASSRTKDKIARMEMPVARQIIGPEPGQPNKCRLFQLLDEDLKGWIPEKVIQLGTYPILYATGFRC